MRAIFTHISHATRRQEPPQSMSCCRSLPSQVTPNTYSIALYELFIPTDRTRASQALPPHGHKLWLLQPQPQNEAQLCAMQLACTPLGTPAQRAVGNQPAGPCSVSARIAAARGHNVHTMQGPTIQKASHGRAPLLACSMWTDPIVDCIIIAKQSCFWGIQ
jgi:hypothetical protein